MKKMTRKGAAQVTADFDEMANLVQNHYATLGIPKKIALDFAYRCDLLSDAIERTAAEAEGGKAASSRKDPRYVDSDDPRAVLVAWGGPDRTLDMGGWTDKDVESFKRAVRDELEFGTGVTPSDSDISIHDAKTGRLVRAAESGSDETHTAEPFTQKEHHELAEKQEGGDFPHAEKSAANRVLRVVAEQLLKIAEDDTHEKLEDLPDEEVPGDDMDEDDGKEASSKYDLFA